MRSRILGLGEEDTFLVHNTRAIKLSKPSKTTPNGITFISERTTGNFTLTSISSNTGFYTVEWWDGTKQTASTGTISKAVTTSEPKLITIYPSTSTGLPSGALLNLNATNVANNNTTIDLGQLKSIGVFLVDTNLSQVFKVYPKTTIDQLNIIVSSSLKVLDCSESNSPYTTVSIKTTQENIQIFLPLSGYFLITIPYLATPAPIKTPILSSFSGILAISFISFLNTTIDYSNSLLTRLICTYTNLATLIVDNSFALTIAELPLNASLSTFRCKNCVFYGFTSKKKKAQGGLNLSGCNLNAAALNQVFEDLGTTNPAIGSGLIQVQGNPGALTCNTSIATAKGYIVITQ
jgi:hypothetical protein